MGPTLVEGVNILTLTFNITLPLYGTTGSSISINWGEDGNTEYYAWSVSGNSNIIFKTLIFPNRTPLTTKLLPSILYSTRINNIYNSQTITHYYTEPATDSNGITTLILLTFDRFDNIVFRAVKQIHLNASTISILNNIDSILNIFVNTYSYMK